MNFIKPFSQIGKNDVTLVGGKGASLGEMTRAGIPVPPGFIITAEAFEYFLTKNDLHSEICAQLAKVNYDDTNSVDKASNIIRDVINDTPMPENITSKILSGFYKLKTQSSKRKTTTQKSKLRDDFLVAVRSSATAEDSKVASWAGELESYLNTTKENLLENVKKCWWSLFTPRAIFYRQHQNLLDTKVLVAVVVQTMIQSEVSGICFTVHPVTKDKNQMIIEAGWGLGEAIVGGLITPDSYIVDKTDFSIIDTYHSQQEKMIVRPSTSLGINQGTIEVPVPKSKQDKQKLTGKEIVELARLAKKIEDHYGHPQDIEWAFLTKSYKLKAKSSGFYIVQSRPITTL